VLESSLKSQRIGILFLFCQYAERKSQTIEELLGSLIQQLLRRQRDLPSAAASLFQKHDLACTRPSQKELSTLLSSLVGDFERVYVVIDALDECEHSITRGLLEALGDLPDSAHRLYTSRNEPHIQHRACEAKAFPILSREEDIRTYLETQIEGEENLSRLCREHQDLKNIVVKEIIAKSYDM
jgi:ankyrin repeat domain-containing protein 50